jgi:hypothetical protein
MASLIFYQRKHGKREGRMIYRKKQRAYRRKHRDEINAAQRARYQALTNAAKSV